MPQERSGVPKGALRTARELSHTERARQGRSSEGGTLDNSHLSHQPMMWATHPPVSPTRIRPRTDVDIKSTDNTDSTKATELGAAPEVK